MDEVDGNSRDTSTDGSSGGSSHIRPEQHLSNSEALPRLHSSWSASQLQGEITSSPHLRGHNISWSDRTDFDRTNFDRTNFNDGPTVSSSGGYQFGLELALRQSEILHPRSVNHDGRRNANESSLTNFPAGGGEDTKSTETKLPLCQQSRSESQSEILFREDEHLPLSGGLNSGICQAQPESSNSLTFELRSELNSQCDKDLDKSNFLPKLQSEVSLRSLQPPQQMDLREHLPKPDYSARRETNTDQNAWMQRACQLSMTGSFIQQCSDVNDFESFGQNYREGLGNSLPFEMRQGYNGTGHLEVMLCMTIFLSPLVFVVSALGLISLVSNIVYRGILNAYIQARKTLGEKYSP